MPIYRGTTPLKAYKGDMQPVNVYKGSTKVAGWHSASYSGTSPLTVDCDYDVPPDALVIDGRCVQTVTPSPSSPAPISTITGNVSITGADGAVSDTATVALGSAVCASLPDGTHDSYDAVTGILTKRVGKFIGSSSTSWTLSDAESNSSILSDCFGADVLDGTSYSAYDAVCQPNLTPFFSRILTDSSYWSSVDIAHITQLADGWAHVSCDNSAGTDNIVSIIRPKASSFASAGKTYATLVEIRGGNVSGTASDTSYIHIDNNTATQLAAPSWETLTISNGLITSQAFKLSPTSNITSAVSLCNIRVIFRKGLNVSFDMRLSLYEGTHTGDYKPYALPCAPTVYYKLATPTTVQLTPHLPVVRTGIKTLSIGADVVPTLSATVKSMESAITSITQS